MNVAVLEPFASLPQASAPREPGPEGIGRPSEWIDPEGDDWFAEIYRELAQEPVPATACQRAPDLDHWFG